jgi:hypothetical protein
MRDVVDPRATHMVCATDRDGRPVISITVNGREWKLGHRASLAHYPS